MPRATGALGFWGGHIPGAGRRWHPHTSGRRNPRPRSDPSQSDPSTKDFWLNMAALTGHLQKQAEQSPAASYYNVALLKYQVSPTRGKPGDPAPRQLGPATLPDPPLTPVLSQIVLEAGSQLGTAAAVRALGLLARRHAGQRGLRLQRRRPRPARAPRQRPRPAAPGRARHQRAAAASCQLVRSLGGGTQGTPLMLTTGWGGRGDAGVGMWVGVVGAVGMERGGRGLGAVSRQEPGGEEAALEAAGRPRCAGAGR